MIGDPLADLGTSLGYWVEKNDDEMHVVQCFMTAEPGAMTRVELAEAYASSDLLVFPSATDTFGNVVLEAHASGIPVIVCDQGGPKENVDDGETGRIVKSNSDMALADAMAAMLSNREALRAMGRQARLAVEPRDCKSAFEKLYQMYTEERLQPQRDAPIAPFFSILAESGVLAT